MRPPLFRDPRFSRDPLPTALKKIEGWLVERRWCIKWSRGWDDHVNFTTQEIIVNSNRTPQSQVFGILHEAGHIILSESSDYHFRFPNADEYKHRPERRHESLRVRAETLGEEWEAWCVGEDLARKLGLEIDYESYHAARNRDLKSYARWMVGLR